MYKAELMLKLKEKRSPSKQLCFILRDVSIVLKVNVVIVHVLLSTKTGQEALRMCIQVIFIKQ